jgi:exodeoxyribonuclease V alpha subunit
MDGFSKLSYRSLLYTAVTRAKKHICIVGAEECVKQTFARRMMRFSGLNNKINVIAAEK